MIRRALDGEVERKLDALCGGRIAQPAEVVDGAERGMDRIVAAFAAADRVRTADVAGRGAQGVVLALAVGLADGMDRRQIKNVKSHVADRRQPADDIGEGAVALRIVGNRARKQLIPGAEAGLRPFHFNGEGRLAANAEIGFFGFAHHFAQVRHQKNVGRSVAVGFAQPLERRGNDVAGAVLGALHGLAQKPARLGDLDGHIGARRALDFKVAAQRAVAVDPGLDGEFVTADAERG